MNPELVRDAHDALRAVTADLDADAWLAPTPCEQWNVSQVFRHAVGDQHAYAGAITGGAGAAENQFAPAPEPPDDPAAYRDVALARVIAAFAGVPEDQPDLPTPWPGSMPAELVAAACALDCVVHAWDIAVATGQPSPLSVAVAQSLLSDAAVYVEPLRAFYAPAQPAQDGDDAASALLRYLGRDPHWAAKSVVTG